MIGDIKKYRELHEELTRISKEPYLETDHERNHQTFAKVLLFILEELTHK